MRRREFVTLIAGAVCYDEGLAIHIGPESGSQTNQRSTRGVKRPRTFSPFRGLKDWRALAGPEDNVMTDRFAELERNGRRLGRIEFEMMTVTLWVLAGAVIALFFLS